VCLWKPCNEKIPVISNVKYSAALKLKLAVRQPEQWLTGEGKRTVYDQFNEIVKYKELQKQTYGLRPHKKNPKSTKGYSEFSLHSNKF
jgi:hypothetical protein